nr:13551_t:CDS:2 [Entrophospora candida]
MILSAPQTPRLKSKLSIDMPISYSGVNTPAFSPLPSPTLSASFASRTPAELTALVKEAYGIIREKERDLTLAAEIGKSLLENNITLKSKYEGLVVQLQSLQRQRQKDTIFTLQANATKKPLAVPIAPPSSSLDPSGYEDDDYDVSDNESNSGWSSSYDVSSPISPIKRSHSKRDHQQNQQPKLTFKELEIIKELELKNQDLQTRLDEVIKEYNETDKIDKAKIRKLESDSQHYQEVYSQATLKIEDLEKETERLIQKQKSDFWQLKYNKKSSENEQFIEGLVNKVAELEEQNLHIERQKVDTEKKLAKITNELDILQDQCNQLIEESKDYEMLQLQSKQQTELIDELEETLEYERLKVVSLRSGSMYSRPGSRSASRSNSFSLRRLSNPDAMRSLFGAAPQTPTTSLTHPSGGALDGKIKRTLLSELENEWFRELTLFQRDQKRTENGNESPLFSPALSEKDLSEFFLPGSRGEEFEPDEIIRREWFWIRWARNVYLLCRLIWRWVKFMFILFAANIMAIYRGPDDILP